MPSRAQNAHMSNKANAMFMDDPPRSTSPKRDLRSVASRTSPAAAVQWQMRQPSNSDGERFRRLVAEAGRTKGRGRTGSMGERACLLVDSVERREDGKCEGCHQVKTRRTSREFLPELKRFSCWSARLESASLQKPDESETVPHTTKAYTEGPTQIRQRRGWARLSREAGKPDF
jgi:hypothetical protein